MRPHFVTMSGDMWMAIDEPARLILKVNSELWEEWAESFLNRIETHDKGCQ